MLNLSIRATAKSGASDGARNRTVKLATVLLIFLSGLFSSFPLAKANPLPFDLLTLQVIKTADGVRIEIAANRSLADAVIEQSAGPREVSLRIMGASSHLESNYSGADQLVHSVRILSSGQRDKSWVDVVIDIDEGTAVTFQKSSNALLIEATRTGYFRPTRTVESKSRPRAVAADTVAVAQPKADTRSLNETANDRAPINRQSDIAQKSDQRPSSSNRDDVRLLALNIRKISGTSLIQVLADRPVTGLVIEQSVGAAETLLRIRGVQSSLAPKYSSADPLISSVRTVSGGGADSPWVDIIIETASGAAISTRKNSNYLDIEVSQIAYFRRTPADEKKPGPKTRPVPAAPTPTSGKSADTVKPSVFETKKEETKSVSQTEATPKSPTSAVAIKTSAAGTQSEAARSATVTGPIKTQESANTMIESSEPKKRANDSGEVSKPPEKASAAATRVTVSPAISTSPSSIVPAGEAEKPATSSADLAKAPVEAPVAATSQRLTASAVQQGSEGELHGVVVDEAGALIVGATVILDDSQGHRYTARTNESGRYELSNVPPGKYVLTAASEGFEVFKQEIEIASRKVAVLDVTLKILVSVQVEVRAGPASDLSGTILTESDIATLPQDPTQLLRKLRQMASMMGIPNAAISVDGSAGERLPPREDIQSIKISPHSFAAQYSQPTSGQIEVTSKPSGHFHGDFSFNFNDESLNARDPFANFRAPLQIREYNGYLSGPIIPNRWSFSAYVGRYEQDENEVVSAIILDPRSLLPTPFNTTVLTPNRDNYFSVGSSYLLAKKHTVRFGYSRSSNINRNQGVGEFSLPERAYTSSSHTEKARWSITSLFNERLINEMHLELSRSTSSARADSQTPGIIVLDSFSGGGNQDFLLNDYSTRNLEFSDFLTYNHKAHAFKIGYSADVVRLRNIDRSQFGGTFTFGSDFERDAFGNPVLDANGLPLTITSIEHYRRTLLGLPGYFPSQFTINRGNPSVNLSQTNSSWFVQDDWRISSRLNFSYGLRHTFQTNLADKLNLAPRLGLAWRPSAKRNDAFRAGFGLFYNYVDSNITLDTVKLNGSQQEEITIQQPQFFPNVPANLSSSAVPPSTVLQKDPNLKTPYAIVSTLTFQPQLPWSLTGSVGYNWRRGVHLLRQRNINAPFPGLFGLRPFPNQGPILQFESTARLIRHALDVSLGRDINSKFSVYGHYTWASSRSDTSGPYSAPANPYDLSTEFGPSANDIRHHFRVEGWMSLPEGLELTPYISVSSAPPFNITTGRDNNGDTIFTDRPSFGVIGEPGVIVTRFGVFNPNPQPGERIIPRNYGRGSRTIGSGLNLSKSFSFGSGGDQSTGSVFNRARRSVRGPYSLTLSADIENFFNHTNFDPYNGVLTSPFFGKANSAGNPRKIKLSMELSF